MDLASIVYRSIRAAGLIGRVHVAPLTGAAYAIDAGFRIPDEALFSDSALTSAPELRYPTSSASLKVGDIVTVRGIVDESVSPPIVTGGESFTVSESPKRLFDGMESMVSLRKVRI